MCRVLGVSRSGLHAWRQRPKVSAHQATDNTLLSDIRRIHAESRGTYGSPRVHAELRCAGKRVGRKRVERLMRDNALDARPRRRFRTTADSSHDRPVAPNILDRQFDPERPNQVWATDITFLWTQEGPLDAKKVGCASPS
jgi:transposase InsO family protein